MQPPAVAQSMGLAAAHVTLNQSDDKWPLLLELFGNADQSASKWQNAGLIYTGVRIASGMH